MNVERVPDAQRLRLAVLGDSDGVHTRSWLRWFVARGHDVHAISFYPPSSPLEGVTLHVLRTRNKERTQSQSQSQPGAAVPHAGARPLSLPDRAPRSLVRLVHAARYRQAGLKRMLADIAPDVFHAHFVVEHGFYGAIAGFHPYVVSAWGSDVLVEPRRDPVSRQIAKWTLRRADLVTSNNAVMADRIVELGAPRSKVEVVTLGADAYFGERWDESSNVAQQDETAPATILSTRAHESLYNIDAIIDAFAIVLAKRPNTQLVVAHGGSLTEQLCARARPLGEAVTFTGTVDGEQLRDLMTEAAVFVSVPSSDGTSVALLQAMSAGAFPVVSDLDTVREWITDGENGLTVPLGAPVALAEALMKAVADTDLRRRAAVRNHEIVRERGTNEIEMARMEALYLQLAGRGV